jgi:hypothetical protein
MTYFCTSDKLCCFKTYLLLSSYFPRPSQIKHGFLAVTHTYRHEFIVLTILAVFCHPELQLPDVFIFRQTFLQRRLIIICTLGRAYDPT